ncbi:hypothetical protein PTQ46_05640 [Klebsiella michiganensis]|nr:hypothetical protein [Klebsiella michiganensis]MBA7863289.1 hypothetical protein [Klebsiella michiganensis]MDS7839703.1 hypothetical protein [Klebsiella michiganensis]HDX9074547.1 hypothetical protein [Klebsiella michiganensis]
MVSFSNMDGAHCDSVVDHYTLPSNSIQMDVKVPVQPSNFDPLQKGALMGASTFMEQDKNHSNQCNYKTKSIPSPGTTIQRTQPMAGFLLFCGRTLHRTAFDYSPHGGSPLRGQRDKRAVQRLRGELSASNN